MIELNQIRTFALNLIEEGDRMTDEVGEAGATEERTRAEVGRRLLAALDGASVASPTLVPPAILENLRLYVEHHLPPSLFLRAVLSGDLFAAFLHADEMTALAMPAIVQHIATKIPMALSAWGSPEAVSRWVGKVRA
jgi:hypothetical protein